MISLTHTLSVETSTCSNISKSSYPEFFGLGIFLIITPYLVFLIDNYHTLSIQFPIVDQVPILILILIFHSLFELSSQYGLDPIPWSVLYFSSLLRLRSLSINLSLFLSLSLTHNCILLED